MSDFYDDLDFSHKTEDLPIWEECYYQFFPTMVSMISHRQNGYWQHEGIDRSVILKNSKQILIDEKARRKAYKNEDGIYDIALEYISNDQTKSLGWVCKPLKCDYIAYAVLPIGKCYLLPVIQLQQAWIKFGQKWKNDYFNPVAPNNGYRTHSVAVPEPVLYSAIGSFLRCNFTPTLNQIEK